MKIKYIILIFFFLGVITRYPFIESYQSHWDGPQYSIGVVSYDLTQETPAPPGYPIYIFFGWVLNLILSDPHFSLLIVGIISAGLSSVAFFLAGRYLFSVSTGVISALLYLSSLVYYFFGLTAYPYGLISAFLLVIVVVVYKIIFEKKEYGLFLGISYGIFCGIRPQDSISLLPLVFFGFLELQSHREKIKAFVGFFISLLAWFMPLMYVVGGMAEYFQELSRFLRNGALGPVHGGTGENIRRIVKGLFLTLGVSSLALTYYPPRILPWINKKSKRKKVIFFLLWIIPSLLSVTFIRNDHSGYQMIYLTAFVLLAAYSLDRFTKKLRFRYLIIAGIVLFNIFWFFRDRDPLFQGSYIQTSFHHSEIRKNDLEMGEKINFIKDNYDPRYTSVVVQSQHFRPVMYHLPEYRVISFSDFETNDPNYSCVIREGIRWRRHEEKRCFKVYSFPRNMRNVIFFESNAKDFVFTNKVVHELKNNMSLTVVDSSEEDKYLIRFNNFRKI